MTDTAMDLYKLIFSGDLLPGHEPAEVRQRLIGALRVPPEKADRLFSGKPVVIKRGLDHDKAQAYRRKLASMGVGIKVEADQPAAPPPTPPVEATPTPPPLAQSAAELALEPLAPAPDAAPPEAIPAPAPAPAVAEVEEMNCPECGKRQPKRTLCMHCGVDMPRVLAAREADREAAHSAATDGPAGPVRVHTGERLFAAQAERPDLLSIDLSGRISRRTYFVWNCLIILAILLGVFLAFATHSLVLMLLTGLVAVVTAALGMRIAVLRIHDFNWSGWWALLLLVPMVGSVFSLMLLFFPGSEGENDHGGEPEPSSWGHAVGALVMVILVPVVLSVLAPMQIAGAMNQMAGYSGGRFSGAQADMGNYDAERDWVVIYTVDGCQACVMLGAQLTSLGVRFEEKRVDVDEAARERFVSLLQQIEHEGDVMLPAVHVNGYLLPNNPPVDEIVSYFGE